MCYVYALSQLTCTTTQKEDPRTIVPLQSKKPKLREVTHTLKIECKSHLPVCLSSKQGVSQRQQEKGPSSSVASQLLTSRRRRRRKSRSAFRSISAKVKAAHAQSGSVWKVTSVPPHMPKHSRQHPAMGSGRTSKQATSHALRRNSVAGVLGKGDVECAIP